MTRSTLFAGMLLGVTASVFASSATAADAKKPSTPYVPGEILVTFKESALASTQAMRVNKLSRGKVVKTIRRFGIQKVKLPADVSIAQAIKTYQGQSAVVSVQPNYRYYQLDAGREMSGQEVFRFGADAVAQGKKKPGKPAKPASFKPNDKEYKAQWNMRKINAPVAWQNTQNNAEVVVAVIDTGVNYQHQDLANNMWRNPGEIPGNGADDDDNGYIDDFYGIDTTDVDSDPRDIDGHGTHVAGVIAAQIHNRVGIAGMNWNAKIMALRVLGQEGGTTEGIVEAMDYMIAMNEAGVNVRVANHSYGAELPAGTPFDPAQKAALDEASEAGILSAIAAGNGGDDGVGDDNNINPAFPAGYTSAGTISVAATDEDDRFASFSNYGSRSVDLAAPGESILSTYPFEFNTIRVPNGPTPTPVATQPPGGPPGLGASTTVGAMAKIIVQVPSNKGYKYLSGTSMAAPHVAGAAAMLFGYGEATGKDFTLQQVKDFILNGVDKVPQLKGKLKTGDRANPLNPESTTNGGRLNAAVSLTLAGASTGIPVPTPTPGPTPDPNATPTPIPTATPIPSAPPLPNGNIVFNEVNLGFFAELRQMGPDGGATTSIASGGSERREFQNPYISFQTGHVAYTANLANVTGENFDIVDYFGDTQLYSFPENEIFVRLPNGTTVRVTNDEANFIDPQDDREPAISPDGKRIVWVRRDDNGNDDLFIADSLQDLSRPGGAPAMYRLVGDFGDIASQERRPSWTPDGKRIVFHSNPPTTAGGQLKDNDIYMVDVPTLASTLPAKGVDPSTILRLTTSAGDDREPSVGPTTDLTRAARPNGQLAYASNRNDNNNFEPTVTIPGRGITAEDFDIYVQDLKVENTTNNRAVRIVDTERELNEVPGGQGSPGSGDLPPHRIDPNTDAGVDDDYFVSFEVQGDDRRPTFTANGNAVIFCSDSNFRTIYPGQNTPGVRDDNPNSDFDIIRVDVNSRNYTRLTDDTPTRAVVGVPNTTDFGTIDNISEDIEPIAGAQVTTTSTTSEIVGQVTPRGNNPITYKPYIGNSNQQTTNSQRSRVRRSRIRNR